MSFEPSQIKLISFDLDDTLWDGHAVIMQAEKAMLDWMAEFTPQVHETFSTEDLRKAKIQFAKANPDILHKTSVVRLEFLKQLFKNLAIHDHETQANTCFQHFYQARQKVELFDGMEDSLKILGENFQIIAITNGNSHLGLIGIDHLFEFCLGADDFPAAKPQPHMFEAALEKTGLTADQCLHVGDHPNHDMLGAFNAGFKTCWLKDGTREWNQDFTADLIISSVNELPVHLKV